MTKIECVQKPDSWGAYIASGRVPEDVWFSAIKCGELAGYESMSGFVRDAIIEKIQSTMQSKSSMLGKHKRLQTA